MQATEMITAQLEEQQIPFRRNEPMCNHTSFRIGGPCAIFCKPQSSEQLIAAIHIAQKSNVPCMPLGKGSNVLFCDEGYEGVILHMGKGLGQVKIHNNHLTVGAGADLLEVCRTAQRASLTGLEFAYGIPGSLGGAIYMNAGAFDGEMCDVVESVSYLNENNQTVTGTPQELAFGYRTSLFQQQPYIILGATLRLQPGNGTEIAEKMEGFMQRRIKNQPLDLPSAGSTFKRPTGAYAGRLIDDCGLRGHRIGNAAVSEKHCGFIVNLGGATCEDVVHLADEVSRIVLQKTGYTLEKEVRVIGPR